MQLSTLDHIVTKLLPVLGKEPSSAAVITISKFIQWRDLLSSDEFISFERNGSFVAKWVADSIREKFGTFPKSHLNDNSWVKALYNELEDHLREIDILPQQTEDAKKEKKKGTKDNPKSHDINKRKAVQDAKRLQVLEDENMQLKARISKLENENRIKENIYADLAAMGADFGS